MNENANEARRQYYRDYYRKNAEKIKENQRRYWDRKAALLTAKTDKNVHLSAGDTPC